MFKNKKLKITAKTIKKERKEKKGSGTLGGRQRRRKLVSVQEKLLNLKLQY